MSYARRFHALGHFLDERHLRDVCVVETDEGVTITGVGPTDESHGPVLRPLTFQLTERELNELAMRIEPPPEPKKRRWLF